MGRQICLFFLTFVIGFAIGGVPHSHSHKSSGGERASDGAFSPKDKEHHDVDGHHDNSFDHEAILGSIKDAEEFDQLPPEEAKERLKILVGKMDINSDGYVDKTELHGWILKSFRSLSQEESEER
jgi:hypothetical protein